MKKIILFSWFAILINTSVLTQSSSFSIGLSGQVNYFQNEFKQDPHPGFDHQFKSMYGYNSGLQFSYKTTEKINIRLTASFFRTGYLLAYNWIAPDGTDGGSDPTLPLESVYIRNYLTVMPSLCYNVYRSDKMNIGACFGLENSFFVGARDKTIHNDFSLFTSNHYTAQSNYLLGIQAGLVHETILSERFVFQFQPYVNKTFQPIDTIDILKNKLKLGIEFSLNLRI